MTVADDLVKLFIRYNSSDNPALETHCPDFEPAKTGGFKHGISFSEGGMTLSTPSVEEPNPEKLLQCLVDFYTVEIDNRTPKVSQALFYIHPNQGEKGIMLWIDVENLVKGPHNIRVSKQILQDSSLQSTEYANIQFWKP
jgi:hypothetical protein